MTKNGLNKAKEFYTQSMKEYNRAKQEKSDVLFRDAAEKGWNAVVLGTNYFIERQTGLKPKRNK